MDEDELIGLLQRFAEIPSVTEEGQALAEQLAGMTFAIHALLQFSCDPEARVLAAAGLARLDPSSAETVLPILVEGLRSAERGASGLRCLRLPLPRPARRTGRPELDRVARRR